MSQNRPFWGSLHRLLTQCAAVLAIATGVALLGLLATYLFLTMWPPEEPPPLVSPTDTGTKHGPRLDEQFWAHWSDGQAEIAAYTLTTPRYQTLRQGTAVLIFVTEPFLDDVRVKDENRSVSTAAGYPVMKLNAIEDFATGLYDYNLMTSVFVALEPQHQEPAGSVVKISFSSQEWCGHTWHQWLPVGDTLHTESHSYFEGEADSGHAEALPSLGYFADSALLWARGMAAPRIKPGQDHPIALRRRAKHIRLGHEPELWHPGSLRWEEASQSRRVPAGTFEIQRFEVRWNETSWLRIEREADFPHRIVAWEDSSGERAELLGSDRLPYWQLQAPGDSGALRRIGLRARPTRTP